MTLCIYGANGLKAFNLCVALGRWGSGSPYFRVAGIQTHTAFILLRVRLNGSLGPT